MTKLISTSNSDSEDTPINLKKFLERNHRLFTVIGVFAALSVYFSQLGSKSSVGVKTGVSASLVLFFITASVGVYRAYITSQAVLKQNSYRSYLRILPFSAIMYSLVFLALAVMNIMQNQYPEGVGGILTSSVIYSLLFGYWTIVATSESYNKFTSNTAIGSLYSLAPYIGLLPMSIWYYWRLSIGAIKSPWEAPFGALVGHASGSVVLHFCFTVLVLGLLVGLDRAVSRSLYRGETPEDGI